MTWITFTVPGEPETKRRQKLITLPDGKGGVRAGVVSTAKVRQAEAYFASFAAAVAPSAPPENPVMLSVECVFGIPSSKPEWWRQAALRGAVRPRLANKDVDNLLKLVMDAMTKAGYWRNDGQVVNAMVRKAYGPKAGVEVSVHYRELVQTKKEFQAWLSKQPPPR